MRLFVLLPLLAAGCASSAAPAPATEPAEGGRSCCIVQQTPLESLRSQLDTAKSYVESSQDEQRPANVREVHRLRAIGLLKETRAAYDAYLDAHPEDEQKLEADYVQVNSMLFWMKKDAGASPLQK